MKEPLVFVLALAAAAIAITTILACLSDESSRIFAVVFGLLAACTWKLLSHWNRLCKPKRR